MVGFWWTGVRTLTLTWRDLTIDLAIDSKPLLTPVLLKLSGETCLAPPVEPDSRIY